ncbi:MAG: hypothetical protein R3A78_03460 [Polyangiales bacterium]|nr:hypothetical protein [Myxococcales bacterium]
MRVSTTSSAARPRSPWSHTALRFLGAASLVVALLGCGAGPYGYARDYEPLGEEDDLLEHTRQTTYEDVRRDPTRFQGNELGWFGVVDDLRSVGAGVYRLRMTYRTLRPRNLCSDETSGSCRVTVNERAGGEFDVLVRLRATDEAPGEHRLWAGSLLRVFGKVEPELAEGDIPVIQATWYRHWPAGTYVTTGAADSMRR